MAEASWSAQYMGTTNDDGSPIRREDVEGFLAVVDDTHYKMRVEPWPSNDHRKRLFLFSRGVLDYPQVLDPLLQERRWDDVAIYLRRLFRYNATDSELAGPAVKSPNPVHQVWDIKWTHPELYMLPRAQQALELAAQGDQAQATILLHELQEVVAWTAQHSSERHAEFLGTSMLALLRQALHQHAPVVITQEQVDAEWERTVKSIHHYLDLYLPETSGRKCRPTAEDKKKGITQTESETDGWQFANKDPARERQFVCLLCHANFIGDLWHVTRHVRQSCPASTESVRQRLIKKNKRKRDDDAAAGSTSHSHGGGGGGGSGVAPGASAAVIGAA